LRISRVSVVNFRNFENLDIPLHDHAVIVGENKVGKSNLLHALRLVLDPSLPDTARQLRPEDFWDGLPRPLGPEDAISIAVELTGFDDNDNQLALLADCLVEVEPFVARLTYVFRPTTAFGEGGGIEADYEFFLYGGDRVDNRVPYEVRRRLPLAVLPALRDTEADLANWRRSPLRPLLEGAVRLVSSADLQEVQDRISSATELFLDAKGLADVAASLSDEIKRIAGSERGTDASLGLAPKDPARLIRELRVLIDDGARGVEDASLGTSNIIYLALKLLEVAQDVGLDNRDHTFLAVEEPEAHLHPHMQRLVYRRVLRSRSAGKGGCESPTGADHAAAHKPLTSCCQRGASSIHGRIAGKGLAPS
jgi:putative ATP-dependent endonuclease of the OLD family